MPFYSTSEMAKIYGIPSEAVYALAGKLPGFFPDFKAKVRAGPCAYRSFYSEYKVRLLGETYRRAPGTTLDDRIKSCQDGFQLSEKEKRMIFPNVTQEQMSSLIGQVNQLWERFVGKPGTADSQLRPLNLDLTEAANGRLAQQRKVLKELDIDGSNAFKIIEAHIKYIAGKDRKHIFKKVDFVECVRSVDSSLADKLNNKRFWLAVRDRLVDAKLLSATGPSGWYKINSKFQEEDPCPLFQELRSVS